MLFEGKVADGPLPTLAGPGITLIPSALPHRERLLEILATPEVRRWWDEPDQPEGWPADDPTEPDTVRYTIALDPGPDGEPDVVGLIQYAEMNVAEYRHAGIDIFTDPAVHGRGIGKASVRTLADFLFAERGHHRLVIDPAAANAAAIGCYTSVGFKPVGLMRQYERNVDGNGWHDGLLMDLLRDDVA
ncbi:MAG: GNAT family N-acetyltransferase [Actinomycetota bacterium]|nr:GNAT family N-acetyltransferase [Actinomycetota bacterium]